MIPSITRPDGLIRARTAVALILLAFALPFVIGAASSGWVDMGKEGNVRLIEVGGCQYVVATRGTGPVAGNSSAISIVHHAACPNAQGHRLSIVVP